MEEVMMRCRPTKRLIDILLSSLLLLVFFPVFILVSFAILLLEGRPVFYISKRYVTTAKQVRIPKFRTMVRDATSEKYQLNSRFMREGYLDIPLSCEVYTGIGRVLEKTQIVELLQLLLVLRGDMSFIGNRPLPQGNINELIKFQNWHERFDAPAGITGIAQVVGKYGLEPEERLELERLYGQVYKEGRVLKCDLLILACTANLLLRGKLLPITKARALLMSCIPGFDDL
jgi:lipopolysaccharide/colanic/teichoic acid biosynthesis glycosyltransferase